MSNSSGTDAKTDGGLREIATVAIQALLLALVVRVFLYQPFNIPSGSMIPTLLVGDYLFVSKLSYGFSKYSFSLFGIGPNFEGRIFGSEPKRGDVAVFKLPRDNSTDYIKRVIGLPGDKIQMERGVLHINGEPVKLRRVEDYPLREGSGTPAMVTRYEETLPNGVKHMILRETGRDDIFPAQTRVYTVPPGHYFMMGDNRDHSQDSRFLDVGYVPRENLIGRAEVIFFSFGSDFRLYSPLTWVADLLSGGAASLYRARLQAHGDGDVRWERAFTLIY